MQCIIYMMPCMHFHLEKHWITCTVHMYFCTHSFGSFRNLVCRPSHVEFEGFSVFKFEFDECRFLLASSPVGYRFIIFNMLCCEQIMRNVLNCYSNDMFDNMIEHLKRVFPEQWAYFSRNWMPFKSSICNVELKGLRTLKNKTNNRIERLFN